MMTLIDQFCCTHCTRGTSVLEEGASQPADQVLGYSVRAASQRGESLRKAYRHVEHLVHYHLPTDAPAQLKLRHTAATAPRRFTYLPSVAGSQVLANVCYRQTDTAGRPGSYFAHVLMGESSDAVESWSALDCLRLWRAKGWIEEDRPNLSRELQPLASPGELLRDEDPSIDDQVLLSFLTTPAGDLFLDPGRVIPQRWREKALSVRREVFGIALDGFLKVRGQLRPSLLLVAEPELAALVFYGVLRLCPAGARGNDISFSTFEPRVERLEVTMAATCFHEPGKTDVPTSLYQSGPFVLNTWSYRRTECREPFAPHARAILDALFRGGWKAADAILDGTDAVAVRIAEEEPASGGRPGEDRPLPQHRLAENQPTTAPAPPERSTPQPPVGIDLGTTYSLVAYLDSTGRPLTVPNEMGDMLTPSAVLFEKTGLVVGKEAIKGSTLFPHQFAECIKRDMGRMAFRRPVCSHEVPPEVLSAFVLDRLRQDAETHLGPIRKAVITVPAFFDEARRKATQDAGALAGLEVLDIINEPTAAAVAYGHQRSLLRGESFSQGAVAERVLVFDLGGGTFDVTVLDIDGRTFRTVATDGDVQLGGKDFDERLVNVLAERFLAAHGNDPRSDPNDAAQLWLDAQEAKHTLSVRETAAVVVTHQGTRMRTTVTRQEFERLTCDLLERTETTTSLVLRQAGLSWDQIGRVLLVGGSTRMPMVAAMLRRISGKEPDRSLSPDEVVAHGAALYCGLLMEGDVAKKAFELANVNSHSLGVAGIHTKTKERVRSVLIPKNSALPCRNRRRFRTSQRDQRTIHVLVVEGESHRPEQCIALGNCVIRDLPPGLPKGTEVEVEFSYAANGILSVVARVPSVRQSAAVEILRQRDHDLEDLAVWRGRLCETTGTGSSTSPDGTPGASAMGRTQIQERLDSMHYHVGSVAAKYAPPPHLVEEQKAVLAAHSEQENAATKLQYAILARQAAIGSHELAYHTAAESRARTAFEVIEQKAKSLTIAFGAHCADARFFPPGSEQVVPEIWEVRKLLGKT